MPDDNREARKTWMRWGCVRALNYARKNGGSFRLWPYGKWHHKHVESCVAQGWLTRHPPPKLAVEAVEYRLTEVGLEHVLAELPPEYIERELAAQQAA